MSDITETLQDLPSLFDFGSSHRPETISLVENWRLTVDCRCVLTLDYVQNRKTIFNTSFFSFGLVPEYYALGVYGSSLVLNDSLPEKIAQYSVALNGGDATLVAKEKMENFLNSQNTLTLATVLLCPSPPTYNMLPSSNDATAPSLETFFLLPVRTISSLRYCAKKE